jgi:hypothetical protein
MNNAAVSRKNIFLKEKEKLSNLQFPTILLFGQRLKSSE